VESKIFITHDIKCAVNASTAGKGDCDCGAVEQAEKQKPVAYLCENAVGYKYFRWKKPTSHYKPIALYTAPPQREWVGLHWDDMPEEYAGDRSFLDGANWAEARLKEKNGGS
jgi:hypothetical protein